MFRPRAAAGNEAACLKDLDVAALTSDALFKGLEPWLDYDDSARLDARVLAEDAFGRDLSPD